MKVILFQPQIPQNTGNIVRTCSVTNTDLILVTPLGFSTSDKWLKRAGLDYWEGVSVNLIDNLEAYLSGCTAPFYFFSSHAEKLYTDISYTSDTILIFGSESAGLPELYHKKWKDRLVTLPMAPNKRCLNLATSVGISIYEGLRQQNFSALT